MNNIFQKDIAEQYIQRIQNLTPESKPIWGKMSVDQVMAHCNVTYEMIYEDKFPKPGAFKKFLLKLLVKNPVVNEKPYKKSTPTGNQFIINNARNFEIERKRLIDFIRKTQELGETYFDGKESHSFGPLNKSEWNNMFVKHLDHHLSQFGV